MAPPERPETADTGARTDSSVRRGPGMVLVAGLVTVAVLVVVALVASRGRTATVERASDREEVTHEFVIPPGTTARIAEGRSVEIVPQRLVVAVGDTIRVRNDDVEASNVGIFYVRPGETVTMRFSSPGVLEGVCDIHPSGQFVIDVRP